MTMSGKKADHGDHIDRISDLPSDVIDGILQHLNILDLVRTSILSRKWRYMWISVSKLEFGPSFMCKCRHYEGCEIFIIISKVLLLLNGPIYKFTLRIPFEWEIRTESLNKWILYLLVSGIKELELVYLRNSGQIPSHVFSCQELTYLKLDGYILSVPPNFCGFQSLLDLRLQYIRFESGALESLISGCPLLEELVISYCSGFECIDFSAPTLKVLRIDFGPYIKPICLKNAKNLIDLTLTDSCDGCDRSHVSSDLINGLPKIQRLVMGPIHNEALSAGAIPLMLRRSFRSLKYLTLSTLDLNARQEFLYVVSLLNSAPNLVELVIQSYFSDWTREPDPSEELELDGCCQGQLRIVNIRVGTRLKHAGTRFKHAMRLVQIILANSPSLEILTFDVNLGYKKSDAYMLLSISRDLLRMERVSQRAHVKFTHREFQRESTSS